ncbi:MAG TPA: hypothetical protein VE733_30020 [Streptosporangiaceae bacterium]|nr:hypothetical protein [Streptosporangiaceae bacterium]
MSRRQAGRIAGGAALLLAAVTACGSSGGGAAAAASPSSSGSSQLVSCLRSHGVNVPASGGSSAVRSALQNLSSSQRTTAIQACHQYLGAGGFRHRSGGQSPSNG